MMCYNFEGDACREAISFLVHTAVHKLFTEHFSEHHHAFKVQRYCELGELVKANSLKFYRPFDLQCLYVSDDGEYIVPFVLV
jgi:hypothetical protein